MWFWDEDGLDENGYGMKLVLDESGIGMKVVLDEIFTFGMKVVLDELVFYLWDVFAVDGGALSHQKEVAPHLMCLFFDSVSFSVGS